MASDGVGGCLRLGRFLPKISALCPFNSRSRVFSNFAPLLAPCLAPALLATSRLEPAFVMDLLKIMDLLKTMDLLKIYHNGTPRYHTRLRT